HGSDHARGDALLSHRHVHLAEDVAVLDRLHHALFERPHQLHRREAFEERGLLAGLSYAVAGSGHALIPAHPRIGWQLARRRKGRAAVAPPANVAAYEHRIESR